MSIRQIGAEFPQVTTSNAADLVQILQQDPITKQYIPKNITTQDLVDTGGGAVVGPPISTDNAVAKFRGTSGNVIQDTGVVIDISNNISTPGTVGGSNLSGTNTGDQTISLTGDITGSGTGTFATTIAVSAVTNNKIATGAVTSAKIGASAVDLTTKVNGFLPIGNIVSTAGSPTTQFLRGDGTWSLPSDSGNFSVVRQIIYVTGLYRPTPGMVFCDVELIGGGGGSGGCNATGVDQVCASSAGGGGGYVKRRFTAAEIGSSEFIHIGLAGDGGAAGNNPGQDGDITAMGVSGTILYALGGNGGIPGTVASLGIPSPGAPSNGGFYGGDLYTSASTIAIPGGIGSGSIALTSGDINLVAPGIGGNSFYSPNQNIQVQVIGTVQPAVAGRLYGGGASGGGLFASQSAIAGADGAGGIAIITEYIFI